MTRRAGPPRNPVIHLLDQPAIDEPSAASSRSYSMTLCDGKVRLLCRPLPGRAVCVAKQIDDVLYVVIDLEKPHALRETQAMLQQRGAEFVEPVVTEAGRVPLVPLGPLPEPTESPPIRFAG